VGKNLVQELLGAARIRMQTQGEFTPELIAEITDEVIDEFMRDGLITDDEDIEVLKTELRERLEAESK
jgi:hypothetical protein